VGRIRLRWGELRYQRDRRTRAATGLFRDVLLDKSRDRARCTCLPLTCFGLVDSPEGSENDPNCAEGNRRLGVEPLGLHKPL
jgi:hypothetical protein